MRLWFSRSTAEDTQYPDCSALAEHGDDEGRLCSGICFTIGRKSRREFPFQDRVALRQSSIGAKFIPKSEPFVKARARQCDVKMMGAPIGVRGQALDEKEIVAVRVFGPKQIA
jgi:hypothetical protein